MHLLLLAICCYACTSNGHPEGKRTAILETLNAETRAAFARDYDAWATH